MAEFNEISPNAPAGEKLLNWVDNRFPLTKLWNDQWGKYYAPKNFNFWYIFGSLAMLVLVIQIVTGIFLVMHYKPDASARVRLGRIHHARRAVGLAHPVHALDRVPRRSSSWCTCTCSAGSCTAAIASRAS